jgi:hypothetical protein
MYYSPEPIDGYTIDRTGGAMEIDFNVPSWLEGDSNVPVPVVDPADLKVVWELQDKSQKKHPGQNSGIDMRFCKNICSPGADVIAIWHRSCQLSGLGFLCAAAGKIFPWLKDGKPDDAVFNILATMPLTGKQSGIEELIRVMQKEYEA